MKTAFGKLTMLAFALLIGILLLAPMRAGQEDVLVASVQSIRMDPGDTYDISYTLHSDTAQTVSYETESALVAEVSPLGTVTAVAPGSTRIRLQAQGGASTTVRIEVVGVPVTSMKLNTQKLEMEKGDVSGLSCQFNEGVTDQRVEWISADTDVVRVDAAGRVTAVGAGETYVVATTPGGLSAAATVSVRVRGTRVQITPENLVVGVGSTFPLQTYYLPEDTTDEIVGWKSLNPSILTVDDQGVVHAVSAGTASVSVTTADGLTGTTSITVEPAARDFQINPTQITMERGDAHTLEAWFIGADGSPDQSLNHHIRWTSSNEAVATVEDGEVIGLSSGTAYITAAADGFETVCAVRVQTTVKSVALNMTELYLLREQTAESFQLKAMLDPEDADDLKLTYASDNPLVASVSRDGVVTPTGGYGTANITVTAASGAQASFALHVVTVLPEASTKEAASVETSVEAATGAAE